MTKSEKEMLVKAINAVNEIKGLVSEEQWKPLKEFNDTQIARIKNRYYTCRDCKYYNACGEDTRTKPCKGRETK